MEAAISLRMPPEVTVVIPLITMPKRDAQIPTVLCC